MIFIIWNFELVDFGALVSYFFHNQVWVSFGWYTDTKVQHDRTGSRSYWRIIFFSFHTGMLTFFDPLCLPTETTDSKICTYSCSRFSTIKQNKLIMWLSNCGAGKVDHWWLFSCWPIWSRPNRWSLYSHMVSVRLSVTKTKTRYDGHHHCNENWNENSENLLAVAWWIILNSPDLL